MSQHHWCVCVHVCACVCVCVCVCVRSCIHLPCVSHLEKEKMKSESGWEDGAQTKAHLTKAHRSCFVCVMLETENPS